MSQRCTNCGGVLGVGIDPCNCDAPTKPCGNDLCERSTSLKSMYCCLPCAMAADGHYEIDVHSDGCNERHASRMNK